MIKKIAILIMISISFLTCDSAVNLVDSVDGPDGVALSLSPVNGTIVISSSITFTAAGGVAPYVFSVSADSLGTINSETGVYTAPSVVGTETVIVTDSYGASANALLEIISPPDYSAVISPTVTSSLISGNAFTGSFQITNSTATGGSEIIYWTLYMSTDQILDAGTDPIADTGNLSALSGNSTSSAQPVSGIWPSVGNYFLILSITAGDDLVSGNNTAVSTAAYTVVAPDIDYSVSFSPVPTGSELTGGPVSETFTLTNGGTFNGSDRVYWTAYLSSDALPDAGDSVLDAGSLSALASGVTSSPVSFTGNWPDTSGTYYLIVSVSAGDDTVPGNDYTGSSAYTVSVPDINYSVSFNPTPTGSELTGDAISENFTITNGGANDGSDTVYWTAYISTNANLGIGTDAVIDTGSISALAGLGTSAPVSFSGNWPDTAGTYYLIIAISAGDDTTSGNNSTSSVAYAVSVPDVNYIVNFTPAVSGTEQVGDSISENFTVENTGNDNGADDIFWIAYLSDSNVLGVGTDTVIDAGILSGINGLTTSSAVNFSGNWITPGTNYIIVSVSAGDDINASNNDTASPQYNIVP